MTVRVNANPRGYLRYRVYRGGSEVVIGTALRDDGPGGRRRALVEAKAVILDELLENGVELHRALLSVLGDCPPRLMPRATGKLSLTVGEFVSEWLERIEERRHRRSYVQKAKAYAHAIVLPYWRNVRLADVDEAAVEDFQVAVMARKVHAAAVTTDHGLDDECPTIALKTAKNIVSGHFAAIIRDARRRHRLPERDPFDSLVWPDLQHEDPDPFGADERDAILRFFWERRRRWYGWVAFLFWSGLRQGEAAALRIGDYDRCAETIRVTKSRTEGEDNAPKTRASRRTIRLRPEAAAALASLPSRPWDEPEAFLFVGATGEPILSKEWPKKSFYPVLERLGIRRRKFYATRHTFVSQLISDGEDLKAIAEYCGTSVAMIERSYGRWMPKGVDAGGASVKTLRSLSEAAPDSLPVAVGASNPDGYPDVVPIRRGDLPEVIGFVPKAEMVPRGIECQRGPPVGSVEATDSSAVAVPSIDSASATASAETPQNRRTKNERSGRRPGPRGRGR